MTDDPPERHLPTVNAAINDLARIVRGGRTLTTDWPTVRAIGEQMHAAGGLALMQAVYTAVRAKAPWKGGDDDPHPAELDVAWDGVGDWRC